jgi:hypothetical protein
MSLLCVVLCLAPVPPDRPLTRELLVGRWDYAWGERKEGWIEFYPDGRYVASHEPTLLPSHAGAYTVRGKVLTLHEGRCPCPGDPDALRINSEYPITLSTAKFPTLKGECRGTVVVLSNPRRKE